MINTLSQKLPCLTYGVQSSTVSEIENHTCYFGERGAQHD